MDMNFCRRCGRTLQRQQAHVFICPSGHIVFANSSPVAGLFLVDSQKRALIARRAIEPGMGKLNISAAGFCGDQEALEAALERETQEELGLTPSGYTTPQFLLSIIDPLRVQGRDYTRVDCYVLGVSQPRRGAFSSR